MPLEGKAIRRVQVGASLMKNIGIDLHRKRSTYVVVDQEGEVTRKRTIPSTPAAFLSEFASFDPASTRVVFEATGNWFWVADAMEELGLEAHLANPRKVRVVAESTVKTDKIDPTALAQLMRVNYLPESRLTPKPMRLLRERLRYRISLVRLRTGLKARVHAVLAKRGIVAPEVSDLFGKTGRAWLERVELPEEYRDNLDGYLGLIDTLTEAIKSVEKWLHGRMGRDAEVLLLKGIPGIGEFGAALILAEIGDIRFFKSKRKLSAFFGVVPGAHNSGGHVRDTGLRKDSNKYARWLLSEAVTKAVKVVPAWQRLYDRVHAGNDRRKSKARMAVMHKMTCAIWRVLTLKEPFDRLHNCPELTQTHGELDPVTGLQQGRYTE